MEKKKRDREETPRPSDGGHYAKARITPNLSESDSAELFSDANQDRDDSSFYSADESLQEEVVVHNVSAQSSLHQWSPTSSKISVVPNDKSSVGNSRIPPRDRSIQPLGTSFPHIDILQALEKNSRIPVPSRYMSSNSDKDPVQSEFTSKDDYILEDTRLPDESAVIEDSPSSESENITTISVQANECDGGIDAMKNDDLLCETAALPLDVVRESSDKVIAPDEKLSSHNSNHEIKVTFIKMDEPKTAEIYPVILPQDCAPTADKSTSDNLLSHPLNVVNQKQEALEIVESSFGSSSTEMMADDDDYIEVEEEKSTKKLSRLGRMKTKIQRRFSRKRMQASTSRPTSAKGSSSAMMPTTKVSSRGGSAWSLTKSTSIKGGTRRKDGKIKLTDKTGSDSTIDIPMRLEQKGDSESITDGELASDCTLLGRSQASLSSKCSDKTKEDEQIIFLLNENGSLRDEVSVLTERVSELKKQYEETKAKVGDVIALKKTHAEVLRECQNSKRAMDMYAKQLDKAEMKAEEFKCKYDEERFKRSQNERIMKKEIDILHTKVQTDLSERKCLEQTINNLNEEKENLVTQNSAMLYTLQELQMKYSEQSQEVEKGKSIQEELTIARSTIVKKELDLDKTKKLAEFLEERLNVSVKAEEENSRLINKMTEELSIKMNAIENFAQQNRTLHGRKTELYQIITTLCSLLRIEVSSQELASAFDNENSENNKLTLKIVGDFEAILKKKDEEVNKYSDELLSQQNLLREKQILIEELCELVNEKNPNTKDPSKECERSRWELETTLKISEPEVSMDDHPEFTKLFAMVGARRRDLLRMESKFRRLQHIHELCDMRRTRMESRMGDLETIIANYLN